jgi:tetratricopeptide (TPR) repeat protein
LSLVRAQIDDGRYADARGELSTAETTWPGDSRVALAFGRLYLARAERLDDETAVPLAVDALEAALAGTARRADGLTLYGRALFLNGEFDAAERMLLEAVSTTPMVPLAYAHLADAAEHLGHADIAERALRRLDTLEGDTVAQGVRAARHRRLGTLALAAEHGDVSVRFLTQAVASGYSDIATLALLSQARWSVGDRIGARNALAQALAEAPDDPDLLRLARTLR